VRIVQRDGTPKPFDEANSEANREIINEANKAANKEANKEANSEMNKHWRITKQPKEEAADPLAILKEDHEGQGADAENSPVAPLGGKRGSTIAFDLRLRLKQSTTARRVETCIHRALQALAAAASPSSISVKNASAKSIMGTKSKRWHFKPDLGFPTMAAAGAFMSLATTEDFKAKLRNALDEQFSAHGLSLGHLDMSDPDEIDGSPDGGQGGGAREMWENADEEGDEEDRVKRKTK
jgi:hypothetical protein